MEKQSFPSMEEACEIMASIVAGIAANTGIYGIQLMLEGYKNDDSALKSKGMSLALLGGRQMALGSLIQSGHLSANQLMDYLDAM
mgnify:CR=1 FL=1